MGNVLAEKDLNNVFAISRQALINLLSAISLLKK
jgi:hypothetical protein